MSATFRLKPEHVAILRALSWEWNDSERWGGPGVDPKRPFGNSLGVERDIADVIDMTPEGEEDGEPCLTEDQEETCLTLYGETLTALLVILSARSFRPGLYARNDDAGKWVWVRRRAPRLTRMYGVLYAGRRDAREAAFRDSANVVSPSGEGN